VRHGYRPHTAVLVEDDRSEWQEIPAEPGAQSGPGLVVYRFGAGLFYANANHFAGQVRALVAAARAAVRWLVVDAGAITEVDYSAARVLQELHEDLARDSVALVLVHVEAGLQADLDRHRLTDVVGRQRIFAKLHDAFATIRQVPGPAR
jgi:MFS superfamily sulfate permease-like transporter